MAQQHTSTPTATHEQYQTLLDWQKLYDWAQTQPAETIIGKRCDNGCCPVARYLQEKTGQRWSVGPSLRLANESAAHRIEKPLWIEDLIRAVDAPAMSEDVHHVSKYITREEFLTALDAVLPSVVLHCDTELEQENS